MTEAVRPQPNKERRISILKEHIARGMELITQGKGREAYRHFTHYQKTDVNGPNIGLDMLVCIKRLLSEDDLIGAASQIARHSSTYGIAGWYVGSLRDNLKFGDLPDLYDPKLVERFYGEVSLIAVEEWLHLLQEAGSRPLSGQENVETDVAAYLMEAGVDLSLDFITRYWSRSKWYLKLYPDKEKELREFAKKYGRAVDF